MRPKQAVISQRFFAKVKPQWAYVMHIQMYQVGWASAHQTQLKS